MSTATDFDRIPKLYRERVRQALDAATTREQQRAALAPFLAIADEAEDAGQEAANSAPHGLAEKHYDEARAAVWARRMAERDDAPPPEVAADTVHAVRDAQRAHLDVTRGAFRYSTSTDPADGFRVVAAHPITYGRDDSGVQVMTIHAGQGAVTALDAVARYLEAHVAALPAELAPRVIALLAATLPKADVERERATLEAIAALVKTLPGDRWPGCCARLDLGTCDAATIDRLAAMPGARDGRVPHELGVICYAIAPVAGIEVKAQYIVEPKLARRP